MADHDYKAIIERVRAGQQTEDSAAILAALELADAVEMDARLIVAWARRLPDSEWMAREGILVSAKALLERSQPARKVAGRG